VQEALSAILGGVQQQVAQRVAHALRYPRQQPLPDGYDAAAAAQWAAANPVTSSSSCSSDDRTPPGARCHFYHPPVCATLSEVYSQARALLQPPPAAVEPAKKGEGDDALRVWAGTGCMPGKVSPTCVIITHHLHHRCRRWRQACRACRPQACCQGRC
jgi:hypothetical protein